MCKYNTNYQYKKKICKNDKKKVKKFKSVFLMNTFAKKIMVMILDPKTYDFKVY